MSNRFLVFLPSALLGFGALAISGIREQYVMPPTRPMAATPSIVLGLQAKDIVVDSAERAVAGMTDYSMRNFGPDSSPSFTIYVGYYDRQVQGKAIHSPKNCLPGAGWEILSANRIPSPSSSPSGTINRVLLSNRGSKALVYYWYQGRGRMESSEYKVKWNLLRDAALYGRTEEALVRIVVPVARDKTGDPAALAVATRDADATAQRVAASLAGAVAEVLPPKPRA